MCVGKSQSYLARKAVRATSRWMAAVARGGRDAQGRYTSVQELRRVAILRRRAASL